jgi:putative DNA primase/helicase
VSWDGVPRLCGWLATYLRATGNAPYLSAIGTRFLVSAVARVEKPGCQADHTLVLDGKQGTGKTSTVRALGGKFVTDGLPNLHDKDSAIHLQGVWIVELGELAAIRRTADVESTKVFLSRTVDRFRPPYGRRTIDVPRQCVFIATTNETQYLKDPTGNRRFWPVSCGAIDLPSLVRDRDQLWAEAFVLYQQGHAWHLTADEAALAGGEQAERVYVSELEQQIAAYLDGMVGGGTIETSVRDVLIFGAHLNPDTERFIETAGKLGPQVAAILQRQGWHRVGAIGRSPNRRVVYRFEHPTHRGS